MTELPKKITDDPYGAALLIRRLVTEQGLTYWRRYLLAFALMAVAAGATAGSAYLLGEVINQAYVDKDVRGIVLLSLSPSCSSPSRARRPTATPSSCRASATHPRQ